MHGDNFGYAGISWKFELGCEAFRDYRITQSRIQQHSSWELLSPMNCVEDSSSKKGIEVESWLLNVFVLGRLDFGWFDFALSFELSECIVMQHRVMFRFVLATRKLGRALVLRMGVAEAICATLVIFYEYVSWVRFVRVEHCIPVKEVWLFANRALILWWLSGVRYAMRRLVFGLAVGSWGKRFFNGFLSGFHLTQAAFHRCKVFHHHFKGQQVIWTRMHLGPLFL